jgi:hypothetical protein
LWACAQFLHEVHLLGPDTTVTEVHHVHGRRRIRLLKRPVQAILSWHSGCS